MNTKFYSQAYFIQQQTNLTFTSQAQPIRSQARAQAAQVLIQAEAQAQVQIQAQTQAPPQPAQAQEQAPAQSSRTSCFSPTWDLYPFAEDDRYSLDLQDEAFLREKQARSEVSDRVEEFCQLERANAEEKKEIMGMKLPVYNVQAKRSIDLALPWHSSTIQIAARNHDLV